MGEMCTHLLPCLQQPGEHPHPWRCLCSIPAVQAPKWCTEPNVQISHTAVEMGRDLWAQFQWGHLGLFSSTAPSQPRASKPHSHPRIHVLYIFFTRNPTSALFLVSLSASALQGWMKLPVRGSAPPDHNHLPATPGPEQHHHHHSASAGDLYPTQRAQRALRHGVRNGKPLGDPNANCSAQPPSPQTANGSHLYQRKEAANRSSMEQSHSPLMYIHGGRSHFNY